MISRPSSLLGAILRELVDVRRRRIYLDISGLFRSACSVNISSLCLSTMTDFSIFLGVTRAVCAIVHDLLDDLRCSIHLGLAGLVRSACPPSEAFSRLSSLTDWSILAEGAQVVGAIVRLLVGKLRCRIQFLLSWGVVHVLELSVSRLTSPFHHTQKLWWSTRSLRCKTSAPCLALWRTPLYLGSHR